MKKPISIFLATALSIGMAGTSVAPSFATSASTLITSQENTLSTTESKDELLKKIELAQEEYNKAKKAYDEGALEFLESNCPAGAGYVKVEGEDGVYKKGEIQKDYYYIDNQLEHLKNSTNAILKNAYEEEGGNLKKQINFKLLKWEANLLDECNSRRANDKNFIDTEYQAPLKLAPELVLTAMTDSMVYYTDIAHPHTLIKRYKTDNAIWDVATNGNMQGGCGSIDANIEEYAYKANPFEGWYDEEEYYYRTGNDQYPIPGKPGQTSLVQTTGHYKTTMKKYGLTDNNKIYHPGKAGFGIFYNMDENEKIGSCSAALGSYNEMNVGGKLYTSDEWRKAVDEYEAPLKENLEKAEKNLEKAKKDLEAFNNKDNTGKTDGDSSDGNTGKEDTSKPDSGSTSDGNTDKPDSGNTSGGNAEKEDGNKSDTEKPDKDNGDKGSTSKPDAPSTPSTPEVKKTAITNIKLSTTKYVYDGKTKTPSVSAYANGTKLDQTKYSVSYGAGRKNIGTYTVKVTGNENSGYVGTNTTTFQIVPKTAKTPSVKAGKKKAAVKWAKAPGGVKYQVMIQKKGSKAKYYSASKNSLTVKKLASKKKYTAKVRSYKKVGGKTIYGNWSKAKSFKVK